MEVDDNQPRRHRRGPRPKGAAKRDHTISSRLNVAELAWLDMARSTVGMGRGDYLRAAAMHTLPRTIPAINRTAWTALAGTARTLDRLAADSVPDARALAAALAALRAALLGVMYCEDEDDPDDR